MGKFVFFAATMNGLGESSSGNPEPYRAKIDICLSYGQMMLVIELKVWRRASPATGSYTIHQLEQQQLVREALSL